MPYEDIVMEIKDLMVNRRFSSSYNDDMDAYYIGAAGYSPMERVDEENAEKNTRADVLARQLIDAGAEAAEAVAKGLRMQGRWRERLLPYARRYSGVPVVADALALVGKRQRDPLAAPAAEIINEVPSRR